MTHPEAYTPSKSELRKEAEAYRQTAIVEDYEGAKNNPYDLVIFITRAQPFHNGHKANVERALQIAKRVIVIIGSVGIARDTRNPFTFEERTHMVLDSFPYTNRLSVAGLRDHPYNDTVWASYVQRIVAEATFKPGMKVGLIGHKKADTEYYLSMFPQWEFIPMDNVGELNATMIRKALFQEDIMAREWRDNITAHVTPNVDAFLSEFAYGFEVGLGSEVPGTPQMLRLIREVKFLEKHAKAWAGSPYTPIFVTVDMCVIRSGHVLVIRRKSAPGEGLLALPGGYLNPGERIADAAVRELYEETKLKVPKQVLRGSIKGEKVYDYPQRSLRGRIITHCYMVDLGDGELIKVKGADDADKAFWMPLTEFYKSQDLFFEDHFFIIEDIVQRFMK